MLNENGIGVCEFRTKNHATNATATESKSLFELNADNDRMYDWRDTSGVRMGLFYFIFFSCVPCNVYDGVFDWALCRTTKSNTLKY